MVRQSLELSAETVNRVKELAEAQHMTEEQVLTELVETGLETRHYSELVDQLASATDPSERSRLKDELARLTFGL